MSRWWPSAHSAYVSVVAVVSWPASMNTMSSSRISSSDSARPVAGSVAAISACTSGASRVGSARHACRISSASWCRVSLAARARRRAGVGNHRGALIGRSARSVIYSTATRSGSAMASEWSSRSSPSTERPSARSVSLRHSVSRSTSVPSTQLSATVSCGLGHVPAEFADVLFGEDRLQRASARKPGFVGEVEQVRPEQVAHFVVNARLVDMPPLRPRMSRAACGEVATTTGGISHLGPALSRVTGPPGVTQRFQPGVKALIASPVADTATGSSAPGATHSGRPRRLSLPWRSSNSVESTIRRLRCKTIGPSAYLRTVGVVEIRAYADVLTYALAARWLA